MTNRTVLVFSQNFYPSSLADAIRLSPVVDFFIEHGFRVKLLTQSKSNDSADEKFERIVLNKFSPNNKDKILVRLLKEFLLGIQLFFKIIYLKKADYYMLSSPPFISCIFASCAILICRGKLIFDVRDIYPDIYVKQKTIKEGGVLHRILLNIEKFIYKNSFLVLTATEGLKKNTMKKLPGIVVKLFRNGYSKDFRNETKYSNMFYVVFHGSLSRFQNIELLTKIIVEMHFKNPDIHFIIIGSGPKEVLFECLDVNNFTFLGRLSNSETANIVCRCQLGLSLRDDSTISKEAFPVKLYEFIGAGIPSISTPINEGGQLIQNLEMGFNINNEVFELISLILKVKNDKELYNSLVLNILKHHLVFQREIIVHEVFCNLL